MMPSDARRPGCRATMLSVITCDAPVTPEVWRGMFKRGAVNSFNQAGLRGGRRADGMRGSTAGGARGAEHNRVAGRQQQHTSLLRPVEGCASWPHLGPPPPCRSPLMAIPPRTTQSSGWPAAQQAARVRGQGPGHL